MSNTQYIVETRRRSYNSNSYDITTPHSFENLKSALSHIRAGVGGYNITEDHILKIDGVEMPKEIVDELIHCIHLRQKLEEHRQQIHANIDKLDIFNLLKFTNLK
jgi:hypothetical protein